MRPISKGDLHKTIQDVLHYFEKSALKNRWYSKGNGFTLKFGHVKIEPIMPHFDTTRYTN